MRDRFDKELKELNDMLIEMGNAIESSIQIAIEALIDQNSELAQSVIDGDREIDELEKEIERKSLKLLLQQQPVASDLRTISSGLKIITDMERIGDQAADISEITILLSEQDYFKTLEHIPLMAEAVIKMVKDSIDAYVNKDIDLVMEVIEYDDVVDHLFNLIKNEVIEFIIKDVKNGEQAMDFLMIAKYFERIGDHAENIAEWVYFSITGDHFKKHKNK